MPLKEIPHIVADRRRFDQVLYTPLHTAYQELERRRRDSDLEQKVDALLGGNIPSPLRDGPKAVLARSVMSPNYEVRRFSTVTDQFGNIPPLYWEYHNDKFTSNNELKRMLGKMYFFNGMGRNNGPRVDALKVIDFPAADGQRFSALRTLWGQNFIEFHHQLFDAQHRNASSTFYDSSDWLSAQGGSAVSYYHSFLTLFVRHAILFENVLLNKHEIGFTSSVFLPTFLAIQRQLGVKPLIVTLQPTHAEINPFWMYYPGADLEHVRQQMRQNA
jgi:hypothetical protein